MYGFKRLSEIYNSSASVLFDDCSRIVLMSDCHRGDGSWADDFAKNQNIYYAALEYYYSENYTYIEIGDGDELWENKRMETIVNIHKDVFSLLEKFNQKHRLHMLYGNHDIVKRDYMNKKPRTVRGCSESVRECTRLYRQIEMKEGLVLKYKDGGYKIFLVHGHQVDFLNSGLWPLARFMVRHLWRPLELFGVNDPTSAAANNYKKEKVEKRLMHWAAGEDCLVIAGHTHRPVFPKTAKSRYFNDGCCVHPNSITAIEIMNGQISLVKWRIKTRQDGILYIGKENIEGPENLISLFEKYFAGSRKTGN